MALAASVAGAAWAGIAAVLKLAGNVNEAISTLLLNYVGADVLAYLVYGAWRDAAGNGQPASKPLPADDHLPGLGDYAHIGIVVALVAAVVVVVRAQAHAVGLQAPLRRRQPRGGAARRAPGRRCCSSRRWPSAAPWPGSPG